MGVQSDGERAVGVGDGWHWVSWVDEDGWPLAGSEPCNCEERADHAERQY